jgi:transposase
MLTVDHYYDIRYLHTHKGLSQREIARQLGHSRKTVAKALQHPIPPGYQRSRPIHHPVLEQYISIIDEWLKEDESRRRKQRHTAKRIYDRLRDEYGYTGSESTVRRYVAKRKKITGEVFYPLVFLPGEEGQVDWGEAWFVENGIETKVQLFCFRLCYSTACFVRAYRFQKLEAFLDAHIRALEYFGGTPLRNAYDNMSTVVAHVGKGGDRRLTQRFKEFRSHYVFESRFCNIARGNEKGHVENLVKHAQRTFMTPPPSFSSLEALNGYLAEACERDLDRRVPARDNKTRRELLAEEQDCLLPLPATPFEPCVMREPTISKQSLIRHDRNFYSAPKRYAHHPSTVKAYADRIEIHVDSECVATHERSFQTGEYILDYEHYIPLLERKPGGIHNARPFKGQPWGDGLERMRAGLEFRYAGDGIRQFIRILLLFNDYPVEDVKRAVRKCIRLGAYSDGAVKGVLNYVPRRKIGSLSLQDRPELILQGDGTRPMAIYDSLLDEPEVSA